MSLTDDRCITLTILCMTSFGQEGQSRSTEEWFNRAITWAIQGDYDDALRAVDNVIQSNQKNAAAWDLRGDILIEKKDYREAANAFERERTLDPNNPVVYYKKGNALYEQGKIPDALSAFNEAIYLNPNYADAYVGKGRLLGYENFGKAMDCFDSAINVDPNNVDAWVSKISLLLRSDEYEAVRAYDEAISKGTQAENLDLQIGGAIQRIKDEIKDQEGTGNTSAARDHDGISGTWTQTTCTGPSDWEFTENEVGKYYAQEYGLGGANGTATYDEKTRTIHVEWKTPNEDYVGSYEWVLNTNLNSGNGTMKLTRKPTGSTIKNSCESSIRLVASKGASPPQGKHVIGPLPPQNPKAAGYDPTDPDSGSGGTI